MLQLTTRTNEIIFIEMTKGSVLNTKMIAVMIVATIANLAKVFGEYT